ncbi:MAG: hypothetical protein CMC04_06005 [Flavobacteriaceae bacterium]|nr:hypothetical protein [Flavobacteriaceae bacterium]
MSYNNFLERFVLPLGDLVNRSDVFKQLKYWRNVCKMSEIEINELQSDNLKEVLNYSTKNIPFYKEFKRYENLKPEHWIKKFPVMDKSIIKQNLDKLINPNENSLIKKSTSGSSGEQGTFYMNEKEQSLNRAIQILWWEWSGWKMGSPILQTGMTLKRGWLKKCKDFFLKTHYYSAFDLSESETLDIIQKFRKKKNFYMGGYASSLYAYAKIAKDNNIKDINFRHAISWGDKVFPHYRKLFKDVFVSEILDTYACSEGLMMASQADLSYYYIMSPHVFIEILDENNNEVKDGDLGHVVVTRLDSRAMPLIRYKPGDLAIKLKKEDYPKSRKFNFPLLEKIIGRDTDIVFSPKGKFLIVHFFTVIFEFEESIKQFRVVQSSFDKFKIEYIKNNNFDLKTLDLLEKEMCDNANEKLNIIWKEVFIIPPTKSGKPQIIESNLNF